MELQGWEFSWGVDEKMGGIWSIMWVLDWGEIRDGIGETENFWVGRSAGLSVCRFVGRSVGEVELGVEFEDWN